MFGKTNQPVLGIDIQKNLVKYCVQKNNDLLFGEKAANGSFFKDDTLKRASELINVLQDIRHKHHLGSCDVVISALNSKLLIRQVPIKELTSEKEIREYLFFELGESIPLPFQEPVFDLLSLPATNKKKMRDKAKQKDNRTHTVNQVSVVVTAAQTLEAVGDAVKKSGNEFVGVDCSMLAYARVFEKEINWSKNFMMVEIDSGSATITIFEHEIPVYTQYQDYNQVNWRYLEEESRIVVEFPMQNELEMLESLGVIIRDVGIYFSSEVSPGSIVDQIYLVGSHPMMHNKVEAIIASKNSIPVQALKASLRGKKNKRLPSRFLLAAGLAMKEV